MDCTTARMPKSPGSFGEIHFGNAQLGDRRRTQRLVRAANSILKHPGGTLPDKLGGNWADLMGLYRLVACPEVTHQAVIATHCRHTLQAMRQEKTVLLIHDATELNFTQLGSIADDLGTIGGRTTARGYICQNTLAVTPDKRVIGLASQILHRRREVPKGESPKTKRDHPDRESRLWIKGCQATGQRPEGALWIDVNDRGADTFEYLDYLHGEKRLYVIRSARDRVLEGEDHLGTDRVHRYLHAYTRDLPTLAHCTIEVPRKQGKRTLERASRTAQVRVAAGPATIKVPHFARGHCQSESLDLWVVQVLEINPPAGEEPLEWLLLTNLPTPDAPAACQRVAQYACRPMVEEYHKGQKTGCAIEKLQFESTDRLEPVIGLLSVVAVQLLRLREWARLAQADQTPARTLIDVGWVKVLCRWRYPARPAEQAKEMTIYEFAMALAKLGGHLNRKSDGFPGWQTSWRGWQKLHQMVAGAEAMRCV